MLSVPGLALAQPALPPHAWIFGTWTGGQFPAADASGPACFGSPTVIFTRDVILRATALDLTFRQRAIETVAATANGLEFRLAPLMAAAGAAGGRIPADYGFGCGGDPNLLRVERRGPDEITFPGCSEFPSPLRRCQPA
jgi:hypothetical protein